MIALRRRLIFWLIKAYIKRWRKIIFYFFATGLVIFFIFKISFGYFAAKLPFIEKETIGMVGPYTLDNLPDGILNMASQGLTKVQKDGTVIPGIVEKWKISGDGKAYAFYLRKNVFFSDGSNLTSKDINYDFSNVKVERPDKYTIVFYLKETYAPFPITVSRPIFKKGYIGVGDYKVKSIKLNGNFVEAIELYSDKLKKAIDYELFYPTYSSLKTAFMLGEVSRIVGLTNVEYRDSTFDSFKNTKIEKKVNYDKLVTLFYNTKDSVVSEKTLREGLAYSMPDQFKEGERNPSPLPHFSYANKGAFHPYMQDLVHAGELLEKSQSATGSGKISLTLDTLEKYEKVAKEIAEIWKNLNLDVKIKTVDKIPSTFQIFLGEFNVPSDPDQYVLWHSDQANNITHYNNLRIDKILEDGRKEMDIEKRKQLYADFQKYLAADPPASFLFFPYFYEVSRK